MLALQERLGIAEEDARVAQMEATALRRALAGAEVAGGIAASLASAVGAVGAHMKEETEKLREQLQRAREEAELSRAAAAVSEKNQRWGEVN